MGKEAWALVSSDSVSRYACGKARPLSTTCQCARGAGQIRSRELHIKRLQLKQPVDQPAGGFCQILPAILGIWCKILGIMELRCWTKDLAQAPPQDRPYSCRVSVRGWGNRGRGRGYVPAAMIEVPEKDAASSKRLVETLMVDFTIPVLAVV